MEKETNKIRIKQNKNYENMLDDDFKKMNQEDYKNTNLSEKE